MRMSLYQFYNGIRNRLYKNKIVFRVYAFFMSDIPDGIQRRKLKKYGYQDLVMLTSALEQIHVQAFCDFGTLLGMIRDDGFIEHDNDIDIGILKGPEPFDWELVEKTLQKQGMKKTHYYVYDGKITEQTYDFKDGLSVDLFLYEPYPEDRMRTFVYYKDHDRIYENGQLRSVKALIYPMIRGVKKLEVHGVSVSIPTDPEDRLLAIYGPGWKIPDPDYQPDRTEHLMELLGEKHDSI